MSDLSLIVVGGFISAITGLIGGLVNTYYAGKKRDHDYKKEYIYRPLCNKITNLLVRDWTFFPEKLETYWKDVESYFKTMIDGELKDSVSSLDEEIEEYNELLVKYEETLGKFVPGLENVIKSAFPPNLIIKREPMPPHTPVEEVLIRLEGTSSVIIRGYVDLFKEALLIWNGGKGVYDRLVDYSEKKSWGYARFFRKWSLEYPGLFENLEKEISNLKKSLEDEFLILNETYKDLKVKVTKIINSAIKLKGKLEKRINKLW